jgi:N-acetylmuramic acid 6-phosphate etherase
MTFPALATEIADDRYAGLDTWADDAILTALLEGQKRALASVEAAIPALARAAAAGAGAIEAGGRLVYLASGSPALMSLADALEVPQTYGLTEAQIVLVLSENEITQRLNGTREDDAEAARAEVAAQRIGPKDCVIATSASGTTPFTLAGLRAAKAAGAVTIGIAGNPDTPLLVDADIAVLLAAGPEVISGSTRMGAGTAQKAALNMLSTLIGVKLGHVHDGLMVNVKADNEKLRGRSARIIMRITGVGESRARETLELSGGEVKPAILMAAGAADLAMAEQLLGSTKGNVRAALASLAGATTPALN